MQPTSKKKADVQVPHHPTPDLPANLELLQGLPRSCKGKVPGGQEEGAHAGAASKGLGAGLQLRSAD